MNKSEEPRRQDNKFEKLVKTGRTRILYLGGLDKRSNGNTINKKKTGKRKGQGK